METQSVFVPNDMMSVANQQMQLFGWKLVGQESTIYHEEPCCKLSFVRELDLPNLDRIRELEDQYPFGEFPKVTVSHRLGGWWMFLAVFGCMLLAFGSVGTVMYLVDSVFPFGLQFPDWVSFEATIGGLLVGLVLHAFWRRGKRLDTRRRAQSLRPREEVEGKRGAIEMEVRELFQSSLS